MKRDWFTTSFKKTNPSQKGVLRGLHFQEKYSQAKLVRCIEGEVFDVAVDLRKGSQTYGKWHDENQWWLDECTLGEHKNWLEKNCKGRR